MAEDACTAWTTHWAESMPDSLVSDKIDDGMIDPGCLPKDRVVRLVEEGSLERDDLPEQLREELFEEEEETSGQEEDQEAEQEAPVANE